MKSRFVAWILILTWLLAGCVSAAGSPEPVTATPNIMPRLDPSPTPSGSTLPLTCQVTDLNVYINDMDGYCFAYPTRFTLGDQPSDKPDVRGPAVDDSLEPIHATLGVEVTPATGASLREQAEAYLKEFSAADSAIFTWSQVQVGGEAGWMVEPVPAMLAYRIVFVQHDGKLFRLMYWPVDIPEAQADLNELTQTTLGSFAFTK
ncbi:MAG TPA: hypothetical protein VFR47_28820 [Anaerolineales bacterium]|nr:hypothetical protein [Anaerolineales bacterium]